MATSSEPGASGGITHCLPPPPRGLGPGATAALSPVPPAATHLGDSPDTVHSLHPYMLASRSLSSSDGLVSHQPPRITPTATPWTLSAPNGSPSHRLHSMHCLADHLLSSQHARRRCTRQGLDLPLMHRASPPCSSPRRTQPLLVQLNPKARHEESHPPAKPTPHLFCSCMCATSPAAEAHGGRTAQSGAL